MVAAMRFVLTRSTDPPGVEAPGGSDLSRRRAVDAPRAGR
jgi:hypothetical protein